MTPQTVNAYYNPTLNEIVFPAAILQPPFFDPTPTTRSTTARSARSSATRSATASTTRAASSTAPATCATGGRPTTASASTPRPRCSSRSTRRSRRSPATRINGELTLGENIADNSGLEIAYKAYHRSLGGKPAPVIDGTSGDERFFYGFAQAFRGKARDAALLAQIKSDPHSPDEFRVNGTVRNHPAFYSTFGVKPGDAMYLPPEQARLDLVAGAARRPGPGQTGPRASPFPPPRPPPPHRFTPRRPRRALRPELSLARAGDGDDRHGRVDHGVDDRQRRRARHEPRLRPRPGARAVALGRLHGRDDGWRVMSAVRDLRPRALGLGGGPASWAR